MEKAKSKISELEGVGEGEEVVFERRVASAKKAAQELFAQEMRDAKKEIEQEFAQKLEKAKNDVTANYDTRVKNIGKP